MARKRAAALRGVFVFAMVNVDEIKSKSRADRSLIEEESLPSRAYRYFRGLKVRIRVRECSSEGPIVGVEKRKEEI
jgi:ribosomal protein S14